MKNILSACMVVAFLLLTPRAFCDGKIHPRLQNVLNKISANEEVLAWVYFQDKGSSETFRNAVPSNVVSERSLRRRLKVRSAGALVEYSDLPVELSYINDLTTHVVRVRQRSRWFNSASVMATRQQLEQLEALPYIRSVELVARFKKSHDEGEVPAAGTDPAALAQPAGVFSFSYGSSFNQVNQIKG